MRTYRKLRQGHWAEDYGPRNDRAKLKVLQLNEIEDQLDTTIDWYEEEMQLAMDCYEWAPCRRCRGED